MRPVASSKLGAARIVAVSACAGFAVAALLHRLEEPAPPTSTSDAAAERIGVLEGRLAEIEAQQRAALERSNREHGGATPSAAPKIDVVAPTPAGSESPPKTPAQVRADSEKETAAFLASAEDAFRAQGSDSTWSRQAEDNLVSHAQTALPDRSSVLSCECRSDLCRVQTAHTSARDYRTFLEGAFLYPEEDIERGGLFSTIVEHNDDRIEAVTFVARRGAQLPAPAPPDSSAR